MTQDEKRVVIDDIKQMTKRYCPVMLPADVPGAAPHPCGRPATCRFVFCGATYWYCADHYDIAMRLLDSAVEVRGLILLGGEGPRY